MTVWAYPCRPCDRHEIWYVARESVDALSPPVCILRVRSGSDWHCAVVDRRQAVQVEGMLLRDAVASDEADCPQCAGLLVPRRHAEPSQTDAEPADTIRSDAPGRVQAAAVALAGRRMMVVLVGLDLLRSAGEAGMLADDLRARFGGVDVVLLAQDDDGAPHYRGEPALLELLAGVPIERMPWKAYAV